MSTIQDLNRALLIIGAGPAGLSAAWAAANAGWQITGAACKLDARPYQASRFLVAA